MQRIFFLILCLICRTIFATTTLATLNIANYNDHGNWATRSKLIATALAQTHADIILLQEVRFDPDEANTRSSYQNMGEQLVRLLQEKQDFKNATIVTQPAMYYPTDKAYPSPASKTPEHQAYLWEGITIISKRKILETGSIYLTKTNACADPNKRVTQYIKIENAGLPLYIFNIHLSFMGNCIADNARETIDYIKRIAQNNPVIVMGDFNTYATNASLQGFTDRKLVDVWQRLHPTDLGYTFPADAPKQRIDLVWVDEKTAQSLATPDQVSLFANKKTGNDYPSDHYGLVLRLPI